MAVLTFSTRVMGKLLDLDFFGLPLDYLCNPFLSLVMRKSTNNFALNSLYNLYNHPYFIPLKLGLIEFIYNLF